MSAENTVKLLWDCANALDTETHTNKLLKSYYINTCRKIAKNNIQIPKEKFAVSRMCPRCSAFWSESEFHLKLKPQQVASSGKARKLISKLEEAVTTQKKGLLTKKQRRRAKWLKKRVCSNVEIRCENCKQKTLVPLQKPKKQTALEDATPAVVVEPEPMPKAKKKKNKNKNKTAGLKISQTTIQQNDKKISNKALKIVEEKPKIPVPSKIVTPSLNAKVLTNPTKPLSNLSQTLKAKKKKKKIATNSTMTAAPVQSKTQQKNSLLQLAALLKTQAKKSNTPSNRLESLLQ